MQEALGSEIGNSGIPQVAGGREGLLVLALVCLALFVALTLHIRRSWMGFAFDSVADDEDTARLLGIPVRRFKLWAFVIGTAGAGVAGGLYAHHIRFIGPDSFGFVESVTVLAMVIVGDVTAVEDVSLELAEGDRPTGGPTTASRWCPKAGASSPISAWTRI